MILQVRFDDLPDVPRPWLRKQLLRWESFGGPVTDPVSGRVLATMSEVREDDQGLHCQLEVLDGQLQAATAGLSLGVSYTRDGEAEVTEVFPVAS